MTFKIGDRVTVINSTPSGRFKIEGKAYIVKIIDREDSRFMVRFEGSTRRFERFVDPDAQDNPEAYLAALNA